jgi:hypothetical protein
MAEPGADAHPLGVGLPVFSTLKDTGIQRCRPSSPETGTVPISSFNAVLARPYLTTVQKIQHSREVRPSSRRGSGSVANFLRIRYQDARCLTALNGISTGS